MLNQELLEAIRRIPVIDVHSHLQRNQLAAENIESVVLYHMLRYPLRAAGAPEGQLWPGRDFHEATEHAAEAIAHHPKIRSTSFAWALRQILADLYDFHEPLSAETLDQVRQKFTDRASAPDWGRQVLDKAGVVRVLSSRTDVPPLAEGDEDPGLRFTIERGATPHAYEHRPWKRFLAGVEKRSGKTVAAMDDFRQSCQDFYAQMDWSDKRGLVSWISSEADFTPTPDEPLNAAIDGIRSDRQVDPALLRRLRGAMVRAMLQAVAGKTNVFQLVYGIQFLTPGAPHPVAKAAPRFAATLSFLAEEFPDMRFDLLNGLESDEPTLTSLVLAHDNVSMSSYWWHTFYPSVMQACWHRRLDMLPATRLCGFFSDGWCVEWLYGRIEMTRRVLANVLAEKIEQGFWTESQAIDVARALLLETPKALFLPDEDIES
jgi:glucuronate isomerase